MGGLRTQEIFCRDLWLESHVFANDLAIFWFRAMIEFMFGLMVGGIVECRMMFVVSQSCNLNTFEFEMEIL